MIREVIRELRSLLIALARDPCVCVEAWPVARRIRARDGDVRGERIPSEARAGDIESGVNGNERMKRVDVDERRHRGTDCERGTKERARASGQAIVAGEKHDRGEIGWRLPVGLRGGAQRAHYEGEPGHARDEREARA